MLGGIISLPFVMFSPMMFDSPGSENNIYLHLLFGSVLLFPVMSFSGAFFPWLLRRWAWSAWFFLFPFFGTGFVIFSATLLQVRCGGNFACVS
ncbi:hypothetical protein TH25_14080 [Thalassospira profundimaris]|uniref:Uncharacterized protein n=2 Tax=Thalassospira profundimaris TaxID=502049 RepID=A0A367X5G1_9PROT|nr:hypothetical protein TH25_14080 [Thalassospira profundimaris]